MNSTSRNHLLLFASALAVVIGTSAYFAHQYSNSEASCPAEVAPAKAAAELPRHQAGTEAHPPASLPVPAVNGKKRPYKVLDKLPPLTAVEYEQEYRESVPNLIHAPDKRFYRYFEGARAYFDETTNHWYLGTPEQPR